MSEVVPVKLRVVPPATEINEARCYTVPEAKALTGLSVSFLRGEIKAGKLPAASFGDGDKRPLRIPHSALYDYIQRHVGR